jgi:hypothetical protein
MRDNRALNYPESLPSSDELSHYGAVRVIWMPGMVAERICTAFKVLARLPDDEDRWLRRNRVAWPEMLRDKVDVHALAIENGGRFENMRSRSGPASARDVTEMEEVFDWIGWIPSLAHRRVVVVMAMCHEMSEYSPRRKDMINFLKSKNKGYQKRTFTRWYKAALMLICDKLNTNENYY